MNWVLIVVAAILLGCMLNGRRKGLIKTIFSLFSVIVALLLTTVVAPVISAQLQSNESLMSYVEDKVELAMDGYLDAAGEEAEGDSGQDELLHNLPLPKAVRDMLVANKTKESYEALAVDNLQAYVVKYVTGVVINAGTFIVVFLVINLALIILAHVLDIISKLPVLNALNKTGGAIIGLVEGLLLVWILCIMLTIFSSTDFAKEAFAQINENQLLSYLYSNNLLLRGVADIVTVLR